MRCAQAMILQSFEAFGYHVARLTLSVIGVCPVEGGGAYVFAGDPAVFVCHILLVCFDRRFLIGCCDRQRRGSVQHADEG